MNHDVEIKPGVHDSFSQKPGLPGIFHLPGKNPGGVFIFRPDKNQAVRRPHGASRNHHPLDQLMGVGMDHDPVLECARFHLVGIADHVPRVRGVLKHGGELLAHGKGGPAAAQKAGIHQYILYRLMGLIL